MSARAPLLACRALRLQAGRRILVDRLDWEVARGELWCVLGPNGIGKSTLLHAVAGLAPPAAGDIGLDGKPLAAWPLPALARLRGLMPQQQADAFSASALDAVLVGRTPYRLNRGGAPDRHWDADVDVAAAHAALDRVGMADFAQADVQQLSGGERQRVGLAALLAQSPALMLLDEPTAHQDVAQQMRLMRMVRELAADHAVVVTCHDINLAARFATHVLLLAPARVCAGTAEAVLTTANLAQAFGCEFDRIETGVPQPLFIAR